MDWRQTQAAFERVRVYQASGPLAGFLIGALTLLVGLLVLLVLIPLLLLGVVIGLVSLPFVLAWRGLSRRFGRAGGGGRRNVRVIERR